MPSKKSRVGRPVYKTRKWRELSEKLRREQPYCTLCGGKPEGGQGLLVDHIHELRDGGNPYDRSNLMVVCYPCHARKTENMKKIRQSVTDSGLVPGTGSPQSARGRGVTRNNRGSVSTPACSFNFQRGNSDRSPACSSNFGRGNLTGQSAMQVALARRKKR